MPTATVGFQIGLELTKIFPVRQAINGAAKYTLEQVLNLARTLQISGSDLLVEEDIAAILGRVWIDAGIARRFKEEILRNTAIVPISNDCALELRKGAGPTLERAFRDQERGYLATVIQLSLLCWTHDRPSLASALSYCLNKRFDLEFPGANPSPGFDGLLSTLDACSSQANAFPWSEYFDVVKERIRPLLGIGLGAGGIALPSNLLLTCLDSLCIMQRMPEEHALTVSERSGCITLIVWAHYLLGLSVLLRGSTPAQSILFSHTLNSSPNVIIDGTRLLESGPEICLLDKQKEVQLRIDPQLAEFVPMEARERLHLRGYSSVSICSYFDEPHSFKASPEFHDAVEYAVAMAVMISRRVARVLDVEERVALIPCSIKHWQIFAAAAVLFHGVSFDESVVIKYADEIPPEQPLSHIQLKSLPCALRNYLAAKEIKTVGLTRIGTIAVDVLVMATVADVGSLGGIPCIAPSDLGGNLLHYKLLGSKGPVQLAPNDFFSYFSWWLAGPDLHNDGMAIEQDSIDIFMLSDFGWTVCLPSYGDNDPTTVNPEKLYIREGVPTDKKTLERKSRVRDAILLGIETVSQNVIGPAPNWVLDVGVPAYKPRCVSPVIERSEFYGARNDGFHLIVKFKGTHLEPPNGKLVRPAIFEVQQSYRAFHDNLWGVFRSPPCEHPPTRLGTLAKLAVDVATAAGNWSWYLGEMNTKGKTGISERIVVVLVRGDARARWLAVGVAMMAKESRRTMLRGSNCCEDCAVEAAAKLPNKWFVII